MTLEGVVNIDLMLGGWLMVVSLGYQTSPGDANLLIYRPLFFTRALLAIFVVVPGFALLVTRLLPNEPVIRFAIIGLAVSPVLPTLPLKQVKLGAERDYAVGLLVWASIGALVATPLWVRLASKTLNLDAAISVPEVAEIIALAVGPPLAFGMALRIGLGPNSLPIGNCARAVGSVLMTVRLAVALISTWPTIAKLLGNGAVALMAIIVALSLFAGNMLGRDQRKNQSALELATATRHPGAAMAIARSDFADQQHSAIAAVLLFFLDYCCCNRSAYAMDTQVSVAQESRCESAPHRFLSACGG